MAHLQLTKITKRYGEVYALDGVSLDVAPGEFVALLGPSGCGKSSLLRIIAGLEPQDEGEVSIDGTVVDLLRPRERRVAMVFQSYALYPYMTVRQNISLPLVMRELSPFERLPLIGRGLPKGRARRADIDKRAMAIEETLGLSALSSRKPSQLSGGQRQRVALGRAMIRNPQLFLMDEPLSNLDAKLRLQMRAEIVQLHRRLGSTFVYVTHDQSEAMTMAHRIAVMMDGAIVQIGTPDAIYSDPVDIRVASFVGSPPINVFDADLAPGGVLRIAGAKHAIPGHFDAASLCDLGAVAVRPEALSVVSSADDGALAGTVTLIEPLGPDRYAHIALAGGGGTVTARLGAEPVGVGDPVGVAFQLSDALLFAADGTRLRPVEIAPMRRSA
ncbi:MAG: ABC transporter ATP-binding protein [Pseudomonadota bacterium]